MNDLSLVATVWHASVSKLRKAAADAGQDARQTQRGAGMKHIAALGAMLTLATGFGAAQAQNFLINKKFVDQTAPGGAQVNTIGPGQKSFLEFNLFNSATGGLVANMTDKLPPGLLGDTSFTPVVTGAGCGGGTFATTASQVSITNFTLPNTPAAGTGPDCRVVFRVIGNPSVLAPGVSNVTNTVPADAPGGANGGTSATGPGGPYQSDAFSASIQVQPVIPAGLSKGFNPASVPLNGNSVLTFTITNNADYPLNNATLTDSVPASVIPQASPAPTSSCGGTATISGQNVTLAGGLIPAKGSCTVTVTVKATSAAPTTYNNNIPVNALTTTEGVTNTAPASAVLTVSDKLTIEKLHNFSSSVGLAQGQAYLTTIRLTNNNVQLTNTQIIDSLPAGVALAAVPAFATTCGTGTFASSVAAGVTKVTISGLTVPGPNLASGASGTCEVSFWTKLTAASGTLTNTVPATPTPAGGVTNTQGVAPVGPASATVVASPTAGVCTGGGNCGSMNAYKDFVDSSSNGLSVTDVNQPFFMRMGAYNPGYDWTFSPGTITDTLPVGVQVDVVGAAGALTLPAGTVVYQANPTGTNAGANNTGGPRDYPGCETTGTVTVNRSATGQDTITYAGWKTEAASTSRGFNWYDTGCWVSIKLKGIATGAYVGGTAPNKPINTIPAGAITLTGPQAGVTNPTAATAPVTILSAVGVEKTFNPYVVNDGGGKTRVTVFLTNKSAAAQTGANLTDTFPNTGGWSFLVATPANASTTCTAGTVTATPGTGAVSIANATIPGGGTLALPSKCSFSADVNVTGPANSGPQQNIIPAGALTTGTPGLTNIVEARGDMYTRARSITLNKTFGNGGAAQGGQPVPLTITVTPDNWPMTNVAFSDSLISVQPGLVVAPNPNISTTCRTIDLVRAPFGPTDNTIINFPSTTPATVTAVAGSTTIALSKAYFVGSSFSGAMGVYTSCDVTVDVVAGTTGNKTNTIPANNATNDQGATNLGPTSATLTVQPNTQLVKAFSSPSATVGAPFTLTLTVFNVNTSPQAGFFITDTLPAGIIADSIASNSCGGAASVTTGGTVVDLPAAGTSVAADSSCAVVVNVRATGTGSFTNDQNNIASSAVINKNTTTSVTVTAATTFDLSIAKTVTSTGVYTPGVSSVSYNLIATNNGPGPAQERIVVKDCLPVGTTFISASGTAWSCVNNVGPLTRGALTCSSEIVCTRNAGSGNLAASAAASTIAVVAAVNGSASGSLVNYAQVNPSATETLTETKPLGTVNGGYETGDPAVGSNNDASGTISVTALFTIGNRVWFDTNNDGVLDPTESPSAGVTLSLFAANASGAATGPALGTVTTDSTGRYRFDSVSAGDYVVVVNPTNWGAAGVLRGYASSGPTVNSAGNTIDSRDNGINDTNPAANGIKSGKITVGGTTLLPTGEDQTAPNSAGAISGAAGDPGDLNNNLTIDFGFYKTTIGNQLWVETNGNTTFNSGTDATPAAVVGTKNVFLIDTSTNTIVATTQTNATGLYSFDSVAGNPIDVSKTYKVATLLPAGYLPIAAGTALTDNNNQAPNVVVAPSYGAAGSRYLETGTFTVVPGATSNGQLVTQATATTAQPTLDIGIQLSYSIGNRVWFDANNNGVLDGTESITPGVSISLFKADASGAPTGASLGTVTTDSTGRYRFDGLLPGDYVAVVNPSNWAAGGALRGYSSSGTTVNSATNAIDSRDNGIDDANPAVNGIKSGKISIVAGVTPPTNEDQTAPNAAGAIGGTAGDAGDLANNLTIDFGFYKVAVGDQLWVESNGNAVFNSGTDTTPAVVQSKVVYLIDTATNTVVATGTSNANGVYSIDSTASGNPLPTAGKTYKVATLLPTGYLPIAAGTALTDNNNQAPAVVVNPGYVGAPAGKFLESGTFTLAPGATSNNQVVTTATATTLQPTLDIGIRPVYSLGDRVWIDNGGSTGFVAANAANGVQDANEPGLDNVAVMLLDGTGTPLFRNTTTGVVSTSATGGTALTTTTATVGGTPGLYSFTDLPAGDYKVKFTLPANYQWTAKTVGANDKDSDAAYTALRSETTATSATVTLGAASTVGANGNPLTLTDPKVDAGVVPMLSLGDRVWVDTNGNGIQDAGEVGLDGVTVTLVNGSGAPLFRQLDGSISTTASATLLTVTTTTQAGEPGRYQFTQLPPGDYQVRFTLPGAGYQWTASDVVASPSNDSLDSDAIAASPTAATATTATITLTAPVTDLATPANPLGLTNPTIDAGIKPVYSVGNRVWLDANNNGIVDGAEAGIDGVMVELWAADANGNPTGTAALASDTTQSGGHYLFTGRTPGNYVVVVMPPAPVNGVAYVSSTGANGKTTGPYEQGSNDYSATGTNKDHGTLLKAANGSVPAGKVISRLITLGPNQALSEDGNATPGRADATPDSQSNLTVDFGLFLPASLGNLTFTDLDANGKFDAADVGLNGVTVTLLDAAGNVVATTVSGPRPAGETRGNPGAGWYYFDNLIPGSYSVRFTPPGGMGFTVAGTGAVRAGSPPETNNSQPTTGEGTTQVVTLVAGDNNPQLDAGFVPVPVPTLSQWMLMLLGLLMVCSAAFSASRRPS